MEAPGVGHAASREGEATLMRLLRDSYDALGRALALAECQCAPRQAAEAGDSSLPGAVPEPQTPGRPPAAAEASGLRSALRVALPKTVSFHREDSDLEVAAAEGSEMKILPTQGSSMGVTVTGRFTQLHTQERGRLMLEVHNTPKFIQEQQLREICEASLGLPAVGISRPKARATGASWIVEFQDEQDKVQFRRLMDGIRFGLREHHTIWTQDLTPYECRAQGIPKSAEFDNFMKMLRKEFVIFGIMNVIGGMSAKHYLHSRAKGLLVFLSHLPAALSLGFQSAALAMCIYMALLAKDEKDDQLRANAYPAACGLSALISTALFVNWCGRAWMVRPFYTSTSFLVLQLAFATADPQHLVKKMTFLRRLMITGYAVFATSVLCLMFAGGVFRLLWVKSPALVAVLCIGFVFSCCALAALQLRFNVWTLSTRTMLHQFMRDCMTSKCPFEALAGRFSKYWSLQARVSAECAGESLAVFFMCIVLCAWSLFTVWSLSNILATQSGNLGSTLGFLLVTCLGLNGLSGTLYEHASVSGMFAESLYLFHRRHSVIPYQLLHGDGLNAESFFTFCESPWTRAGHPLGHAVAGVLIDAGLMAKLLYAYGYVIVVFVLRGLLQSF